MESPGESGMLQKCISTWKRPVPGRKWTPQSRASEHSCHVELVQFQNEPISPRARRWKTLCPHFITPFMAAWRNGIASDYESGDCRFDPCGGHYFFELYFSLFFSLLDTTRAPAPHIALFFILLPYYF
jgi:hypothetical protein